MQTNPSTATPYAAFLESKRAVAEPAGFDVPADDINPQLFEFQRQLTRWALRKGRAAIFADTGLGKSAMQLEWARHVCERSNGRVLILAPLAVAQQTIAEGVKFGVAVTYARRQDEAAIKGVTISNYERMANFDPAAFGGVVLDESSILKAYEGKTRTALIEAFGATPYRLCCTATPAPNDVAELANHAEFLGVMSRVEMLSSFFIHDDEGWRLKGHAAEPFYRWLASWGMSVKRPSDLGFPDDGFALPPLSIRSITLPTEYVPSGQLFATTLKGVGDRAAVRRQTMGDRIAAAVALVAAEPDEQWLLWVGLNDEGRDLARALPGAVLVEGKDDPDAKADALMRFARGETRILVTKGSIAGFGMNFQSCARMAFVGLGDSYELYYQCVRRCWRFGQRREVIAHVILTEPEETIYGNVLRKEREAERTAAELIRHVAQYERAEIGGRMDSDWSYGEGEASGEAWRLMLGDSAERLAELPDASVDLAIFSPPFSSLFTYSPTERDLGNSRTPEEFWSHFAFIIVELKRVMRPGRNVCVHVAQLTSTKATEGVIGLKDFRGQTINHFQDAGLVYHGEVCIDKDPQVQAIRTHSKGLLFAQKDRDSSWLRPALADFILVFKAPGDNAVPVKPDISNDDWISWARPVWYGIRETDTLNVPVARGDKDERHICPLQLGVIERCIRLWSNKGETVLTPFAGIGSEVYEAVRLGRRGIGVELKPEYFRVAVSNLERLDHDMHQPTLFDLMPAAVD